MQFIVFQYDAKNPKSIPNNNVREIVQHNDTLFLATQNSMGRNRWRWHVFIRRKKATISAQYRI